MSADDRTRWQIVYRIPGDDRLMPLFQGPISTEANARRIAVEMLRVMVRRYVLDGACVTAEISPYRGPEPGMLNAGPAEPADPDAPVH